jgi:AraC family transcriptional regulator
MSLEQVRIVADPGGGWAGYPAGASFGPRRLRDYEWVWIVEGQVRWEQAGVEHAMPPGSVLLARPGMVDAFRWDPKRRTRHGFIHCTIEDAAGSLPPPERWPLVVQPAGENVLLPLLRHAVSLLRVEDPRSRQVLEQALRLALVAFVGGGGNLPGQLGAVDEHPLVARALGALRQRWDQGHLTPLTLGELAAAAEVSPGHLIRIFNQELGASPQEVQRLLRLERATTLLARSNLKIQEVAEHCGFACPFHFSRVFKQTYGASPRALRRRLHAGESRPVDPLVRRLTAGM